MSLLCGGFSEVKDANEEVQKICDKMKPHAENKTGLKFDVFTAKYFQKEVIVVTNYSIKVQVGKDDYVNLRVYENLPHAGEKLTLHSTHLDLGMPDDDDF